jgi:hypothetical protein
VSTRDDFLLIYPTFEKPEASRATLPGVLEEASRAGARVIVHDSSVKDRDEKWAWLRALREEFDFFLLLTDNCSMAHARNLCLRLGVEMYAPRHACMLEDDHGVRPGFIEAMANTMDDLYGRRAPNGFRYGLFSACSEHCWADGRHDIPGGHFCPDADNPQPIIGGVNSCCRAAPISHWISVLKGYDTDEYPISTWQTRNLVWRNYHRGYTHCIVRSGDLMFSVPDDGRGTSMPGEARLWDEHYTASDPRSEFIGKPKAAAVTR